MNPVARCVTARRVECLQSVRRGEAISELASSNADDHRQNPQSELNPSTSPMARPVDATEVREVSSEEEAADDSPSRSGESPGQSGATHGKSGESHGKSGEQGGRRGNGG
jgi:hypothetical protein